MSSKEIPKLSAADLEAHFGERVDDIYPGKDKSLQGGDGVKSEKIKKENIPPIDLDRVVFTDHALERFEQRFKDAHPNMSPNDTPTDFRQVALRILAGAKEKDAIESAEKIRRLVRNKLQEVRYFKAGGWRFVCTEEGDRFVVTTIERAEGSREQRGVSRERGQRGGRHY